MCPVWEAHQVYNYDQCSDTKLAGALSILWPREGADNGCCGMFVSKTGLPAPLSAKQEKAKMEAWNAGKPIKGLKRN